MKRRTFVKSIGVLSADLLLPAAIPYLLQAEEAPPAPELAVRRVLLMFKCHFDAGFIDTQANVVRRYFTEFFPNAIKIAAAQNGNGKRRYTWTTGSWLLYEYLEQASPADRKIMEQAIAQGDIAWHALPFTWQSELLDQSMIEGSLALSQSLDKRFGRTTIGAKMTDVPGHTRALIAPLAKHGIRFLHIGVNSGSTPPQVPPIFLWKNASGASIPVMYNKDYGGVVRVPNSELAISIEVRGDNGGPHTPIEIAAVYASLAKRFPNAEIAAASLSEIAIAVAPHLDALPVVTEEIGDTWIYGIPSDPLKVARYREVARLRQSWIDTGKLQTGDADDVALLRHLLLEVEHTWGTDTKTWLDFENYKPADLAKMLDTKNYKVVQFSWQEKRQNLFDAVATLPQQLQSHARQALQSLAPTEPKMPMNAAPHTTEEPIDTKHFIIAFDPQTGAIVQLRNKKTGREWAGKTNPIALFTYQTLSKEDYDRFMAAYVTTKEDWAAKDFGKPNMDKYGARKQEWSPHLVGLHVEHIATGHRIVASLEIKDIEAFHSGRAAFPRKVYLEALLLDEQPDIHLNLTWFQKPATRLPEAIWFTFNPITENTRGWSLDKSGEPVSPSDVITSGNRHMHAVSSGFSYKQADDSFTVETLDAPVVALGERSALKFDNHQPDLGKGIHISLYNNAWGTNYIMWYGEDARFRFILKS